jgi:hypothetical protein
MTFDRFDFEIEFLDAFLRSPNYVTACDVAKDLNVKYDASSAKKVGPVVNSIARDGLIQKNDKSAKSRRSPRHGGLLHSWAAIDIELIRIRRDKLAAIQQARKRERPATQRTLPGFD